MENNILFNVDEYFEKNQNLSGGNTMYSVSRELGSKLTKKIEEFKEFKINKIITNGNIASVLMDLISYTFTPNIRNITNGQIYPMGKFQDIPVFVDPYMRWSDNFIHFEYEPDIKHFRKIKIQSLENTLPEEDKNIKYGRIYSGVIIDTKGILL